MEGFLDEFIEALAQIKAVKAYLEKDEYPTIKTVKKILGIEDRDETKKEA